MFLVYDFRLNQYVEIGLRGKIHEYKKKNKLLSEYNSEPQKHLLVKLGYLGCSQYCIVRIFLLYIDNENVFAEGCTDIKISKNDKKKRDGMTIFLNNI